MKKVCNLIKNGVKRFCKGFFKTLCELNDSW